MAKHAAADPDRIEVSAVVVDADEPADNPPTEAVPPAGRPQGASAPAPFPYPDMRRSRRVRKVLIALIVVVVLAIVAVAGVTVYISLNQGSAATEQAEEQSAAADQAAMGAAGANDAVSATREGFEPPAVAPLIGMTTDEAIAQIGHGATNVGEKEVDEEDNPVTRIVTIELSDEPADTRTGTPSVYLGLDEDGRCIEATFSTGLSQLGYAQMSFADAVSQARVVDNVLASAGVAVAEGAIALPANAADYTTYAADGTTVEKETFAFSGSYDADGSERAWTATLTYDYPSATAGGAVTDAVRRITVTVEE